ncbi:hypothetical protein HCN44_006636 [Aphidius gifuensis]|uniref:Uncharacterized protein n=1 Tax=Aphidius gifuensis TaxID=684658 RepID=A0A834Y1W8_APHGI|nr:uncharacterized protein LOC122850057 isoform X2 [Aphidius gifuensis]KAF7995529.1 hypothetical protein HCN44_006636 [Aphidius gifuensis]
MAKNWQLGSFCGCSTLKTGTIFTGICGIVLSILTIIFIFITDMPLHTIIISLDRSIVRIIYLINLVMTIFISTLLIIGALQRKTFMMLPWVVLGIILAIGALISVIYTAVAYFLNGWMMAGIIFLIFGLIFVAAFTYLWFVVYSYFQQVKDEKARKGIDPYGRPYSYRQP